MCLFFSSHLGKKVCWPVDEVSPSYESLCLRLSGGLLWTCPSLGAEMSMLLLLSLLLELRPGLDSPSRPELSWEEGEECATRRNSLGTYRARCFRKLHTGADAFSPGGELKCGREKKKTACVSTTFRCEGDLNCKQEDNKRKEWCTKKGDIIPHLEGRGRH